MSEPFIGEIRPFGFNFAPVGWAQCDGQLLSIAQYSALFSLLGTTYGGDGQSTFGLPDLRGRAPVHPGNGPGLPPVSQGEVGGAETVTLLPQHLPPHGHTTRASADLAAGTSPAGNLMGAKGRGGVDVYAAPTNLTALAPGAVSSAGSSQAHDNMQPSLVVNFCIALEGIYPSRN
ncbi:MAG: phage tail protein [Leptothrix sp. (in: Bacteria)]|nr:phage tail protein [Leptothrix sp. (in: b-proteobacteria)]